MTVDMDRVSNWSLRFIDLSCGVAERLVKFAFNEEVDPVAVGVVQEDRLVFQREAGGLPLLLRGNVDQTETRLRPVEVERRVLQDPFV